MGMDLLGRDWDLRCGAGFWRECLFLAKAFGWKPAGTKAPAPCHHGDCYDIWDGAYSSNDWQEVIDKDAGALAAALTRAIEAVMMEQLLNTEQMEAIKVFKTQVGYFDLPSRPRTIVHVARVAQLAVLANKSGFIIA